MGGNSMIVPVQIHQRLSLDFVVKMYPIFGKVSAVLEVTTRARLAIFGAVIILNP